MTNESNRGVADGAGHDNTRATGQELLGDDCGAVIGVKSVLDEMTRIAKSVAALPPTPRCFMASHAVPYGQVYRQWNTNGELLAWVNRGEVMDIQRRSPNYAIGPNAIDIQALMAIPVVLA